MKFELPTELASIIKVIGVGGGGSNAVNHMFRQGIRGVDFVICNTDKQALDVSPIPVKLQLGAALTEGLGAGSIPERGNQAAQENIEEIRQLLNTRTKMLFITAGMGGGTGTGAAPVIARIAKDMGVLTVGIVTMPFLWEGRKRKLQAAAGVEELRQTVDTLLVINNDRLRDLYGNLTMDDAFAHADNVLTTAARGIADIITVTGKVNVDFEDVRTVMTNSGVAIMGMAESEGEDRALRAAQEALASPLLNDNDIRGAKYVLLNVAHGSRTLAMDEMSEITDHIQDAAGASADVIFGYCLDESLGDKLRVTIIATGFQQNELSATLEPKKEERKVMALDADLPTMITAPIVNPVATNLPRATPPVVEAPMEPFIKTIATAPVSAPVAPPVVAPIAVPTIAEQQRTIEFEIDRPVAPVNEAPTAPAAPPAEVTRFNLYEEPAHVVSAAPGTAKPEPAPAPEARPVNAAEHMTRVEDRFAKMREMTLRLRQPNGLSDLEREPAYKRKNVAFEHTPLSTDSNISRYTLSEETDENGERRVELKRNNPFLHDNVD